MSLESAHSEEIEANDTPEYYAISPPSKPLSEYSYAEQRAELLNMICDLGHNLSLDAVMAVVW